MASGGDNDGDHVADDVIGDVWMTYGEIAAARGIKRAAAIRLVQRHRWTKREGSNDGFAHILVPAEWAKPGDRTPPDDVEQRRPTTSPRDNTRTISALQAAIAALREHLEQANRRTEADAATIAKLEQRADRAEQGRDAERAQADALRDRLNAMQAQLADAHAALQAAEAANTRADRAERATNTERERADRAEAGRDGERARADELRARIEAMQAQLAARQEVVDAAEAIRRADDARRALSRWGRFRRAWRGE